MQTEVGPRSGQEKAWRNGLLGLPRGKEHSSAGCRLRPGTDISWRLTICGMARCRWNIPVRRRSDQCERGPHGVVFLTIRSAAVIPGRATWREPGMCNARAPDW